MLSTSFRNERGTTINCNNTTLKSIHQVKGESAYEPSSAAQHVGIHARVRLKRTSSGAEDSSPRINNAYLVDLSNGGSEDLPGNTWQVERTFDQFNELHEGLVSTEDVSDIQRFPFLPAEGEETAASLQQYLRQLLWYFGDDIWHCKRLLSFLDDTPGPSGIYAAQVNAMTGKIAMISTAFLTMENRQSEFEAAVVSLHQRLIDIQRAAAGAGGSSSTRRRSSTKEGDETQFKDVIRALAAGSSSGGKHAAGGSSSVTRTESEDFGSSGHEVVSYREADVDSSSHSVFDMSTHSAFDASSHSAISAESVGSGDRISSGADSSLPSSEMLLPTYAIPTNEAPNGRDEAIDAIISLLQPQDTQVAYRSSARSFVSRIVRRSLNARVFETGFPALRCFLPDDSIRLSVTLWRGNAPNWHLVLNERLCRIAETAAGASPPASDEELVSDSIIGLGDEDHLLAASAEHTISRISCSTAENGASRLYCVVDSLPVELIPNARSDLCFLAFLEEITTLVGKDNLFKRSLLLVRAWWIYETPGYTGSPTKYYLSDSVICALVCSIFNQYHKTIFHPLQALCIFLREYASVDWSSYAVTLQGLVPFDTTPATTTATSAAAGTGTGTAAEQNGCGYPSMKEPSSSDLLSASLLQKYWDAYNLNISPDTTSSSTSVAPTMPPRSRTTSTDDATKFTDGGGSITPSGNSASDVPALVIIRPSAPVLDSSSCSIGDDLSERTHGTARPLFVSSSSSELSGTDGFVSNSNGGGGDLLSIVTTNSSGSTSKLLVEGGGDIPAGDLPRSPLRGGGDQKTSSNEMTGGGEQHFVPKNSVASFVRHAMNIVHPLGTSNMMTSKITPHRARKISKIFQLGARSMFGALKLSCGDGSTGFQIAFNRFFRNVLLRFGTGWRPDVFGASVVLGMYAGSQLRTPPSSSPRGGGGGVSVRSADAMVVGSHSAHGNAAVLECGFSSWDGGGMDSLEGHDNDEFESSLLANANNRSALIVSLEHIWNQIKYCDLLLYGQVSEFALLVLSKEILLERGTLPVGEIGKMLQDVTSTSSLSGKLKEKFGGLKKFLERYPDEFVICTDHPFNPHVFIRKSLTPEDLEMVNRGVIPQQLTAKFRKAAALRNKRRGSRELLLPQQMNPLTANSGGGGGGSAGGSGGVDSTISWMASMGQTSSGSSNNGTSSNFVGGGGGGGGPSTGNGGVNSLTSFASSHPGMSVPTILPTRTARTTGAPSPNAGQISQQQQQQQQQQALLLRGHYAPHVSGSQSQLSSYNQLQSQQQSSQQSSQQNLGGYAQAPQQSLGNATLLSHRYKTVPMQPSAGSGKGGGATSSAAHNTGSMSMSASTLSALSAMGLTSSMSTGSLNAQLHYGSSSQGSGLLYQPQQSSASQFRGRSEASLSSMLGQTASSENGSSASSPFGSVGSNTGRLTLDSSQAALGGGGGGGGGLGQRLSNRSLPSSGIDLVGDSLADVDRMDSMDRILNHSFVTTLGGGGGGGGHHDSSHGGLFSSFPVTSSSSSDSMTLSPHSKHSSSSQAGGQGLVGGGIQIGDLQTSSPFGSNFGGVGSTQQQQLLQLQSPITSSRLSSSIIMGGGGGSQDHPQQHQQGGGGDPRQQQQQQSQQQLYYQQQAQLQREQQSLLQREQQQFLQDQQQQQQQQFRSQQQQQQQFDGSPRWS